MILRILRIIIHSVILFFKKVDLLYTTFIYTIFTIYSVLSRVLMYAIGVNGQGSIKSNKGEVQEFQFLSTAR